MNKRMVLIVVVLVVVGVLATAGVAVAWGGARTLRNGASIDLPGAFGRGDAVPDWCAEGEEGICDQENCLGEGVCDGECAGNGECAGDGECTGDGVCDESCLQGEGQGQRQGRGRGGMGCSGR